MQEQGKQERGCIRNRQQKQGAKRTCFPTKTTKAERKTQRALTHQKILAVITTASIFDTAVFITLS